MDLPSTWPLTSRDLPRLLVIGAGSRGCAYTKSLLYPPSGLAHGVVARGAVVGVAEPHEGKRRRFVRRYILRESDADAAPAVEDEEYVVFSDWAEMVTGDGRRRVHATGVDAVLVCTLDETHEEIVTAIRAHFPAIHIFCEKPLTEDLASTLRLFRTLQPSPPAPPPILFSTGHVLRYSPLNALLKRLVCTENAIGEVSHIDWTEPVGHWHFAHSYVRGNWNVGAPSLLTKCCHDIDFLMWLLCSPSYTPLTAIPLVEEHGYGPLNPTNRNPPGSGVRTTPHLPTTIFSTGSITHFRKSQKPRLAGDATNCLSCRAEPDCVYSAKKIYIDRQIYEKSNTGWPVKIVVPDIEDLILPRDAHIAETLLLKALSEDYVGQQPPSPGKKYYGRCVYESPNDVVDTQVTTLIWEDDDTTTPGRSAKTATLTMASQTDALCTRRGRIYGSKGEICFSAETNTVTVTWFLGGRVETIHVDQYDKDNSGHGGGDFGLVNAFVGAVRAVKSLGWSVERAQKEWIGMDVEEIVRSHLVVWAAEEARLGKKLVNWGEWYDGVKDSDVSMSR
ncbi:hypothetical protein DFH27DRAFT_372995 [Peziza echinospora]|nr:hypothetical protein DFH27DRAFT_372995 [Peziza echinospora]